MRCYPLLPGKLLIISCVAQDCWNDICYKKNMLYKLQEMIMILLCNEL